MFRLYLDTSVFGGCFDYAEGFDVDSSRVISAIQKGVARLLFSQVLVDELAEAPESVINVFKSLPFEFKTEIFIDNEVVDLAESYLAAKIISEKWRDDCLHVASATVARADAIVSWNFKHIVRFDKIKAFNAVNFAQGYGMIQIVSQKEVVFDE